MAITNLTGTKWTFNETLSFESGNAWNINFNSVALIPSYMGGGEKTSFTQLKTQLISYMGNACGMAYVATDTGNMALDVYQATWNGTYSNENSRTIEIIDGVDVEDADLIAFLEANAVMEVQIDLTGTTWLFKEEISGNGDFYVDFVCDGVEYFNFEAPNTIQPIYINYNGETSNSEVFNSTKGGWQNRAYRTITITGGDDVQNPDLIGFLQANAVNPTNDLSEYLTNVADAIREIKGTSEKINAQFIPQEIKKIKSVGKYLEIVGSVSLFCHNYTIDARKVEQVLDYDDTANITDFTRMFEEATKLDRVPNLNYSNGERFYLTFYGCSSLKEVNGFNTDNAIQMGDMFRKCSGLEKIDITKLVADYYGSGFCWECASLKKLIIRTMDTIPTFYDTFYGCYHFTGEQNDGYNPEGLRDGRMYVPDDKVDELKATEGWSDYADLIVPLSTLEE